MTGETYRATRYRQAGETYRANQREVGSNQHSAGVDNVNIHRPELAERVATGQMSANAAALAVLPIAGLAAVVFFFVTQQPAVAVTLTVWFAAVSGLVYAAYCAGRDVGRTQR